MNSADGVVLAVWLSIMALLGIARLDLALRDDALNWRRVEAGELEWTEKESWL